VGGEEFAWLLPGVHADAARTAAERVRAEIGRLPVGGATMSASAGICDLARAGNAAELYRLADGALYWAKAHGRNVTYCYSAEVVEELSATERAERLERLVSVGTVRALARAVDAKDPTTLLHSERVAALARAIALERGWDARRATALHDAGLVHDVGKIGVPDAVLFKPGPLDDAEVAQVREHSALGAQMLTGVMSDEQVAWVRGHHERLDGSGYPDGLAGADIPDGALILGLADAWDAMTSDRPYSDALCPEAALFECRVVAGAQFCPETVDALERLLVQGRLPHVDGVIVLEPARAPAAASAAG
jgi:HD-GYP domain-containing protein (c-di-GMP phosphodiesterase class II)